MEGLLTTNINILSSTAPVRATAIGRLILHHSPHCVDAPGKWSLKNEKYEKLQQPALFRVGYRYLSTNLAIYTTLRNSIW